MSPALPSRPLLLGSCLGPVDPAVVTLKLVCGLLVAGNVHQLQVLSSEKQTVEVLPVHLPPVLDCFSQRGHHGALLLYSAKSGEDSPSAASAAHHRALCTFPSATDAHSTVSTIANTPAVLVRFLST